MRERERDREREREREGGREREGVRIEEEKGRENPKDKEKRWLEKKEEQSMFSSYQLEEGQDKHCRVSGMSVLRVAIATVDAVRGSQGGGE